MPQLFCPLYYEWVHQKTPMMYQQSTNGHHHSHNRLSNQTFYESTFFYCSIIFIYYNMYLFPVRAKQHIFLSLITFSNR